MMDKLMVQIEDILVEHELTKSECADILLPEPVNGKEFTTNQISAVTEIRYWGYEYQVSDEQLKRACAFVMAQIDSGRLKVAA